MISLLPAVLMAQTIERQVIGSTGGYGTGTNIQVSSTVGETVVATGSSSTVVLTQGFQQPGSGAVGIEEKELGFSMNVYPNPTTESVTLDFECERALEIKIELMDVAGKSYTLPESQINVSGNEKHQVDFSGLANGNYFIRLTTTDGALDRSVKILKAE